MPHTIAYERTCQHIKKQHTPVYVHLNTYVASFTNHASLWDGVSEVKYLAISALCFHQILVLPQVTFWVARVFVTFLLVLVVTLDGLLAGQRDMMFNAS